MSDERIAGVANDVGFEIPTSIVERYLARPSHVGQMVFSLMCFWRGEMDVSAMRESWRRVLQANVRTHSTMMGKGHRAFWRVDSLNDDLSRHLILRHERYEASHSYLPEHLPDVGSGVGVNMILWVSDDGHSVTQFQFHHACVDGVGASRLVGDTFKQYQSVVESKNTGVSQKLSSDAKPRTNSAGEQAEAAAHGGKVVVPDLRNTVATLRGKNVRLIKHADPENVSESLPDSRVQFESLDDAAFQVRFDAPTSSDLRKNLKRQGVPVNDFGVAVTLRALADVTSEFAGRRNHLMVMNPVQNRTWAQRRMTNNHVGFAYIRRRHQDLKDFSGTLGSVHEELTAVREHGIANELAWGMEKIERIPGALALIDWSGWFTPTASLTCLSSFRLVRRFGFDATAETTGFSGLSLQEITGIGPIQAHGELAVTILDLGETIAVGFRGTRGNRKPKRNALSPAITRAVRARWAEWALRYNDQVKDPTT